MSRTAIAAVSQTPTGANAHRLIVVIRYTAKSTGCSISHSPTDTPPHHACGLLHSLSVLLVKHSHIDKRTEP